MRILLVTLLLARVCLAQAIDFQQLQKTSGWLVADLAKVRVLKTKPVYVGPLMGWKQTFYVLTYHTADVDEWVWLTPDKAGVWKVTGYRARRANKVLKEWGSCPKPLSTKFR
ncbi:hypothetical protein DYH09_09585 [bacterium CPR1]|nr:hypothetical protein [bacterium CPR1]